jgi:hypothetical protein
MPVRDKPANGAYRRDVERLLEQIRTLVREVGHLQRAGVRGRELEERKRELDRTRRRLATLISHRLGEEYRSAA